ncbi:dnaJ homolog subfamily C member 21-like [Anneissia japonica]|uniref:dnaJ homolog subfamily C member 21-like n=1 Tax=Anneissia japonica TaxID=1529436 RepID=UPI0014259404|nr:dnaJ homolog subfamily C member 21-like [Anneissia japonica]
MTNELRESLEINVDVDVTEISNPNADTDNNGDVKQTEDAISVKKKGKKAKQARKEARQTSTDGLTETPPVSLVCNTCNLKCKSKNKLFIHLKESGHALRLPSANSPSPNKEDKRKKGKKSKGKSSQIS